MSTGTEGPDNLTNDGDEFETVEGFGGDDTITITVPLTVAAPGFIQIDGGAGFDILVLGDLRFINGVAGETDRLFTRSATSQQAIIDWVNVERVILTTASNSNFTGTAPITFGAAEDWVTINNNGNVPVLLETGAGADRVILNNMQVGAIIDLGEGDDLADFSASAPTQNAIFTVYAGSGNDVLIGSTYRDEFYGGDGDDELDGRGSIAGQPPDFLYGSLGNDVYYAYGRETIHESIGEGFDTIYTTVSYGIAAGVSIEQLGTIDWRNLDPFTLVGNELTNSIIGNNGHNAIYGGLGDDSIRGLGGNDVMDGQAGTDYLIGGMGDDIYYVDGLDTAEELVGEGYDSVYASTSYTLNTSSEVEMLATTDYLSTAALSLSGNQLNNYIVGNNGDNIIDGRAGQDSMLGLAGNDLLIGGSGIDYMIGGSGNDNYYVDAGDTVDELANEGFDSVYASNSYVLTGGSHVELLGSLDYQSTAALDLTGNDLGQSIIGSYGANVLLGLGGNDSINGLDGADWIDGGAGQDYLIGGAGNDTFVFSDIGHSSASPDTIADFASGIDKIDLSSIDADSSTVADDVFTFIGSGAFTGQAGQLRVEGGNGAWEVLGDTNGDSVFDFRITIYGSAPVQTDFVF